ncbi:OmpP1/FadL family transporter [Spongiimicrobium sp. 3-5]|uniref:OmpP1/FadL family transporter n=1 Tax=Spongiimicrobium sp. 3-5 TaxID=3332596 RepID=UPI0039806A60
MNKRPLLLFTGLIFNVLSGLAQAEALTSSPYSLYGLGVINQTGIGKSNGLGHTGIGLKTHTEINNLNPANYALIPANSFFYDVGLKGEYNSYSNSANGETKQNLNFSNLAIAFRISEGLGAGVTMVPYSNVGYSLIGIRSNVEGSEQTFESNVSGLGGLNDLRINLGYEVIDGLRLGFSASLLFGSISEDESFELGNSTFQSTETTNYNGLRLGFGMQYDLLKNVTIGSTIQLPSSLGGTLERTVVKSLFDLDTTVEDNESDEAANFEMPLELGFGISAKLYDSWTVSADYKKNYWNATGQQENIGDYADQDIYAIGLEYLKDAKSFKYKDRIRYRAGFNYDNGYLDIGDTKIDGFGFTTGIGIPMRAGTNSLLNLSYGYGSRGQIQNVLIQENYHMITLNLSLEDLWFKKRKIN